MRKEAKFCRTCCYGFKADPSDVVEHIRQKGELPSEFPSAVPVEKSSVESYLCDRYARGAFYYWCRHLPPHVENAPFYWPLLPDGICCGRHKEGRTTSSRSEDLFEKEELFPSCQESDTLSLAQTKAVWGAYPHT